MSTAQAQAAAAPIVTAEMLANSLLLRPDLDRQPWIRSVALRLQGMPQLLFEHLSEQLWSLFGALRADSAGDWIALEQFLRSVFGGSAHA